MSSRRWMAMIGLVVLGLVAGAARAQVTFAWVEVGNPGNAADTIDGDRHLAGVQNLGSVAETFWISIREVTNDQYAEFLNAVAASDPTGLYNGGMEITQSGSDGSFTYEVDAGLGSRPIHTVSYFDVMRFVNWLENGQGSGDTETGVYAVSDGLSETRAPGATYFIPNLDEWYKAAYHDPRSEAAGGPPGNDNYWAYPTQSDVAPTAEAPAGGTNSANFAGTAGDTHDVGAYPDTTSFYGVFNMAGNVTEFNEDKWPTAGLRIVRGGHAGSGSADVFVSDNLNAIVPTKQGNSVGFRVATASEPGARMMGDANLNGSVDDDDLSLLLASWGQDVGWTKGNFNEDDTVNDDDLSLLLANWTGTAAVPEPASALILALGFAGTALWRGRK